MRAGDTVFHAPSGETWLLATDPEGGYVSWAGWPEGQAYAKNCTLVEACSDEAHRKMLEECASIRTDERGHLDHRAIAASRQLSALLSALGKGDGK